MRAAFALQVAACLGCASSSVLGAEDVPPPSPTPTASPSPRTETIAGRVFVPGQCYTWDTTAPIAEERTARPVPCDQPHLIQVTTLTSYPREKEDYPTVEAGDALQCTGVCREAATALLGRPLDPHGKYAFGGIAPTPASWKRGERSLACGIVSRDSEGSTFALFTGDARNAPDQTRLRPVGTCLGSDPATPDDDLYETACSGPHQVEVTGHVDVDARSLPADDRAWDRLVGAACGEAATRYLGRAADGRRTRPGWFPIAAESWDAGRRKTECSVGIYGSDWNPEPVSGPIRDQTG